MNLGIIFIQMFLKTSSHLGHSLDKVEWKLIDLGSTGLLSCKHWVFRHLPKCSAFMDRREGNEKKSRWEKTRCQSELNKKQPRMLALASHSIFS